MIRKKHALMFAVLLVIMPMSIKANGPIATDICNITNHVAFPVRERKISPDMNYEVFMQSREIHEERLTIEETQRREEEKLNREIAIKKNDERLKAGNHRQQALSYALEELGMPYYWGAEGNIDYDEDGDVRDGYDCSGLVQWAYWKAGYYIPRTTRTQWQVGERINKSEAEEGDLIYFLNNQKNAPVDHVGIYLGDNKMLHAPRPGKTVEIRTVPWGNMVSIRRNEGVKWEEKISQNDMNN